MSFQADNLDRKEADSDLNQKAENGMSNEDDIEDDQDPGGELNEVGDDKKPEEKKVEEYNMFNWTNNIEGNDLFPLTLLKTIHWPVSPFT